MEKIKQLGIWMDHSIAHLMDLTNGAIVQSIIVSEFTHDDKKFGLMKDEKHMHIKKEHMQSGYYKKLSEAIINYQEVVLFGPTEAKNELLNLLKTNHLFKNIKIEVKDTDKMTENQMHAFVREYFK
jgi:predicted ATP-dependent Lon-type protease